MIFVIIAWAIVVHLIIWYCTGKYLCSIDRKLDLFNSGPQYGVNLVLGFFWIVGLPAALLCDPDFHLSFKFLEKIGW